MHDGQIDPNQYVPTCSTAFSIELSGLKTKLAEAESERDRLRKIVRHCERHYGRCWEVCPGCGGVNDADKEHNCGPRTPAVASELTQ